MLGPRGDEREVARRELLPPRAVLGDHAAVTGGGVDDRVLLCRGREKVALVGFGIPRLRMERWETWSIGEGEGDGGKERKK